MKGHVGEDVAFCHRAKQTNNCNSKWQIFCSEWHTKFKLFSLCLFIRLAYLIIESIYFSKGV
jgi:meiotically up-regulated gene 157 (Mug157) protein